MPSSAKALATTHTATPQQQGAPRSARATARSTPATDITAELYVRGTPQSVRLALHVVNTAKKRVELTFPSGQTYEFVILDSLDRELWRWGRGRMFTQTLRNVLLSAGETMDLDETWEPASLPPGRYTARAQLTSETHPLVRQTQFTITGTTVASR